MIDNGKVQKMIRLLVVTLSVYVVFRCLLPLFAPFVIAWAVAVLLRPSACWISEKLQFTWRGRKRGIGPGIVGIAELLLIMAGLGILIYLGGSKLYQEACLFINRLPYWIKELDIYLTGFCHQMEEFLSLKEDVMVVMVQEMILNLMRTIKSGIMPYLMGNSFTIAKCCVGAGVMILLFAIGVMLFIQEMDRWKTCIRQSVFKEEFQKIGKLLGVVANAYLRTQGLIILLTTAICTVGFWLLGNPYSILAGIAIGLLDALPVFGTGTILIPWAVILAIRGKWMRGLAVLGLYIICYFVREFVETKLMGDKVGLSPLETLIAVYVGLQLFGVAGVFLGPMGVLIVKEFW